MADEKSESEIKNALHATSMGGGESLRARRKKAETTAKKDKLQQEIQKEIVDNVPQLESTKLKEKLKELDKKIEEAKKLEEEEQKTISPKTENKVNGLKKKFDPNNMENLAKFLVDDSKIDPKLLEKITGKTKKTKSKTKETTAKATKIEPLSAPDDDVVDILKKILTFMQKSYDEDKSQEEQSKNLEEGLKEDKEKKDKELLDALKEAKDKKDNPTAKEEKEEEESFIDKLLGVFGLGDGALSALSVLGRVAGFFMGPVGAAILGATSIAAFMLMASKESHEEASKVQGAMDLSTEGKEITEAADDEVASKKANILRQAHKEGAIKSSWYEFGKQGKEEEDYLKSVGFDAKTGTTSKERESSSTPAPSATGPSTPPPPPSATGPSTPPPPPPAPTPTAEATPNVGSNISQKLNAATKENVFGKLDEKINSVAGAVVNNTSASSASKQQSPTGKLPAVRNQEDTFMRMIYNNTRVV